MRRAEWRRTSSSTVTIRCWMSSTFLLETRRLRLRPVAAGDIDDLVALHEDPLVARYLGVRDRDWYERRVEASAEEWAERGLLGDPVTIYVSGSDAPPATRLTA